ncbi:MAG: tetratricopeptide repeat protein [Bacteroidales bacterium]|nr:tetratricopeptide repeat protein [Bacteroidales bacterium]
MYRKICFLIIAIAFLGGQEVVAQKKGAKKPNENVRETNTAPKKGAKPGEENTRENNTMYIEALNQKIQGNYADAIQMFEAILKKFPYDHASMYELADIYGTQNELPMAIRWATKASEHDPDNDWYYLSLSELYLANHEPDKSVAVMERLVKRNPNNMDYVESLAMSYLFIGEYEKAVTQLNIVERQYGISEELSMQKYEIYKNIGKNKKAIAEIEKLIKYFPNETRYYSILADAYLNVGMKKDALKAYEKILEINPKDPYIHIALADYYRQEGNIARAKEELKKGFANPDLDFTTKLQLVGILVQISPQSDNDIKEMLKTITQAHPDEPEAWGLYAEIALQEKNYAEVQKALVKMVASDSTRYSTWEMLLYTDYTLGDFAALAQHAATASRFFPLQPLPFFLGGIANYQLGNYTRAVQMLERGKDFVFDDPKTLEDFYILLGDSYHQLKNDEKCFYYYEKVLEKNPKSSVVLNNYAYYLALAGKDLERAEKMSFESLKLDANNSSNMDTYGWVLYKMGRYEDAALWIKKALEKDPDNGTLNDHYGDIMYKLGKVDDAVAYWKKAKEAKDEKIEGLDRKIEERRVVE